MLGMTVAQAKAWLRARLDKGESCPVCNQFAKIYSRPLYGSMAYALILLWNNAGEEWAHWPDIIRKDGVVRGGGDNAKLAYWGLAEEHSEDAGMWRITPNGIKFVKGLLAVPKYAKVYDGKFLGLDGEFVTIRDVLQKNFDYEELMAR